MSVYSELALAHIAKYGPEGVRRGLQPYGTDTRATKKTTRKVVKDITKETDAMVQGPITRLLSTQTGIGGFVLKSIKTIAGTTGATSVVIEMESSDGTTIYVNGSTSYTP